MFNYLQLIRREMVASINQRKHQASSSFEIYGKMQAVFIEMDSSPIASFFFFFFFFINTNLSICSVEINITS
jgi:hypothetical protein